MIAETYSTDTLRNCDIRAIVVLPRSSIALQQITHRIICYY